MNPYGQYGPPPPFGQYTQAPTMPPNQPYNTGLNFPTGGGDVNLSSSIPRPTFNRTQSTGMLDVPPMGSHMYNPQLASSGGYPPNNPQFPSFPQNGQNQYAPLDMTSLIPSQSKPPYSAPARFNDYPATNPTAGNYNNTGYGGNTSNPSSPYQAMDGRSGASYQDNSQAYQNSDSQAPYNMYGSYESGSGKPPGSDGFRQAPPPQQNQQPGSGGFRQGQQNQQPGSGGFQQVQQRQQPGSGGFQQNQQPNSGAFQQGQRSTPQNLQGSGGYAAAQDQSRGQPNSGGFRETPQRNQKPAQGQNQNQPNSGGFRKPQPPQRQPGSGGFQTAQPSQKRSPSAGRVQVGKKPPQRKQPPKAGGPARQPNNPTEDNYGVYASQTPPTRKNNTTETQNAQKQDQAYSSISHHESERMNGYDVPDLTDGGFDESGLGGGYEAPPELSTPGDGYAGAPDLLSYQEPDLATTTDTSKTNKSSPTVNLEPNEKWEIPYDTLEFGSELGKGAFGLVNRGTWRSSAVAIKTLRTTAIFEDDEELLKFKEEAALMMNMRPHANVIQFLGVCTNPEHPLLIVVEFLGGGAVVDFLEKKTNQVDIKMAVKIACDTAAGMDHLHHEKVVHRDLATRNLLMTNNNADLCTIKICDFGMSRFAQKQETRTTTTKVGPLKWMPPESIKFRKYSQKSDVWAYGVVLWEIFARGEPYPGMTPVEVALEVVSNGARLIPPPCTPKHFADLMKDCWKLNMDDRPSFSEIYGRCEQFRASIYENIQVPIQSRRAKFMHYPK